MQQPNPTLPSDEMRPSKPLSKLIDWLTATFLVLGGLGFAALGAGLYSLADRQRIADWVTEGTLTSTELTDAELIDTTQALLTWGGVGTAVTGLLLVVSGVAFLVYRIRVRHDAEAVAPDSVTLAIVGGVVTIVTSFIPLSPILGGAVSGYFRGGDTSSGARVGAYAGLIAAIPFVLLGLFLVGGLVVATAELGLGSLGVFAGLATVFGILVSVAYLVGLSALGGYIGVAVGESREPAT
jgi:hypothetical protein